MRRAQSLFRRFRSGSDRQRGTGLFRRGGRRKSGTFPFPKKGNADRQGREGVHDGGDRRRRAQAYGGRAPPGRCRRRLHDVRVCRVTRPRWLRGQRPFFRRLCAFWPHGSIRSAFPAPEEYGEALRRAAENGYAVLAPGRDMWPENMGRRRNTALFMVGLSGGKATGKETVAVASVMCVPRGDSAGRKGGWHP